MTTTQMSGRDLTGHVDHFGNISVQVTIGAGSGPGTACPRMTGASARPAAVARFLRELADEVEHAGNG